MANSYAIKFTPNAATPLRFAETLGPMKSKIAIGSTLQSLIRDGVFNSWVNSAGLCIVDGTTEVTMGFLGEVLLYLNGTSAGRQYLTKPIRAVQDWLGRLIITF